MSPGRGGLCRVRSGLSHVSKEDAAPASGLDLLERVVRKIALPIIAIGGINQNNALQVMQTGVYGIAVISAVCSKKTLKGPPEFYEAYWSRPPCLSA